MMFKPDCTAFAMIQPSALPGSYRHEDKTIDDIVAEVLEETQMIGYAVVVVITLGSFIAVIQKFTQPINELKVVIQKLNERYANQAKCSSGGNRLYDAYRI